MTEYNKGLIDSIQTQLLRNVLSAENPLNVCKGIYYLEAAKNGGIPVNKMNWGEINKTTVTDDGSLSIYNTKEANENGNN